VRPAIEAFDRLVIDSGVTGTGIACHAADAAIERRGHLANDQPAGWS
jgi:hypothetical protein